MRLLSIISGAVFGGAHNQALRLAQPLLDRGCSTTVVLPDEPGDARERLTAAGVDVLTVPFRRLRTTTSVATHARFARSFPRDVRSLRRVVEERQIDVVQVHGPTNPQGALAGRLASRAVVWQLLDTRAPMPLRRLSMPLVVRLADVVMSTGRTVAEMHPGATALGIHLVPFVPPVDTAEFRERPASRNSARQALGAGPESFVVGTIGNRNPQKGHEHLLRAVIDISRSHSDVMLRIRGAESPPHPEYAHMLQTAARAGGLDEATIESVGNGASVADVLQGFDVFVLSSVPRSEGLPTAVLEAMACGLPVVATDVGGVREIVEDGATGLVVPARDGSALARAIERLRTDPQLRAAMGKEGQRRVRERWDISQCVETHLRAYALALERASSRRAVRR